jgi:hypothetical protein
VSPIKSSGKTRGPSKIHVVKAYVARCHAPFGDFLGRFFSAAAAVPS